MEQKGRARRWSKKVEQKGGAKRKSKKVEQCRATNKPNIITQSVDSKIKQTCIKVSTHNNSLAVNK